MQLFTHAERAFAGAVAKLGFSNPFLPERIEFEREALGDEFRESGSDWNVHPEVPKDHLNVTKILSRAEELVGRICANREQRRETAASAADAALYEDLAVIVMYYRYRTEFDRWIEQKQAWSGDARATKPVYLKFAAELTDLFDAVGLRRPSEAETGHLLACFFHVRRAFHHIFKNIFGISGPAARFRAAVWQSIFTHDMRRYRRVLFNRMTDFTTLITGPSGTGKELAARAIALARYIPFDTKSGAFCVGAEDSFHAVNLSALSPTLIESELFGHRRGSFTGALADRSGWLEVCPALGTVFLDEIGDLDPGIQLKLLRVLHERTFQQIGDTKVRRFEGRIIAATNRDLAAQRRQGRFRDDFYYRLCSDMIVTPTLHERVADAPEELGHLILFIARRLVDHEAEALAGDVERFVESKLGRDYAWPGNVRELEQCVRNVLVRGEYRPAVNLAAEDDLAEAIRQGSASAEELVQRYCAMTYARCGSYQETARRLKLDRRTVKARVDECLRNRAEREP